jgi:hypothetical protein
MTDRTSAFDALAAASAALLAEHHPGEILTQLMGDCLGPLSADAAAILVVKPGGDLDLLAASSHHAEEIEMLQTQHARGPCIDAVRSGLPVRGTGDELVERWQDIGVAVRDAGFESVHAFPMRWHGRVLGGLNVFRTVVDDGASSDPAAIGQAFADVATLVLVQMSDVSTDQIAQRVQQTISARSAVEQAKGVLAHVHATDIETAYEALVQRAADDGASLVESAWRVIREQHS